jgi:hypothetical protein
MNINLPEVSQMAEQYVAFKYVELFATIGLVIFLVLGGLCGLYIGLNFLFKLIKEGEI